MDISVFSYDKQTAMDIHVQVFVGTYAFFSLT